MPVRRFNYTGRRRIRRSDVHIVVDEPTNGPLTFDAYLDLDGYGLPQDALVRVEAYRQTNWMPFDFGTVGSIRPPDDRCLTEFGSADAVLFRVRVTSASPPGLLLAEADRLRPKRREEREEQRISLLPVRSNEDIRHEVFRLDFSGDTPVLEVTAAAGDWRALVRDPAFMS
ncbi:MAG TPA: hypothetical protein EYP14_19315, partial [Planctomycetaceae bacterium]|nr:hypothetical protein [Planctomycetaceae bacterium]